MFEHRRNAVAVAADKGQRSAWKGIARGKHIVSLRSIVSQFAEHSLFCTGLYASKPGTRQAGPGVTRWIASIRPARRAGLAYHLLEAIAEEAPSADHEHIHHGIAIAGKHRAIAAIPQRVVGLVVAMQKKRFNRLGAA